MSPMKFAILAAFATLVATPSFAAQPVRHHGAIAGTYGLARPQDRAPSGRNAGYDRQLVGRLPDTSPFDNGY